MNIFWFRRDLRIEDNVGLFHALNSAEEVLPIFIFDEHILSQLPKEDARVSFIHAQLEKIQAVLNTVGKSLAVFHGKPIEVFEKLITENKISAVYTNHDYEPYARNRDKELNQLFVSKEISFLTSKDQVIFEKSEVVKDDGTPYVVFTPYSKKWKENFKKIKLVHYPSEEKLDKIAQHSFWNELIWREFFMQILWHFPHTKNGSFRSKYDAIQWDNNEDLFEKWCSGQTGYPFVDAGMRELNATGHMHNRVRMIVASFLCKHLLIDWRWGETYFAQKLLDYEMSSNVGNWQWAAGSGVDAAPYFRIFNPTEQIKKFDKDLEYIKKWIPELNTDNYPKPIVDHKEARERCLRVYKEAVG